MKVAVQHGIKHVVALLEVGCQVLFDAGMHSPSLVLSLQSHTRQVTPMSVHKARSDGHSHAQYKSDTDR